MTNKPGPTTNVKVLFFSSGLVSIAFWILGYFQPDLMATLPTGGEATITAFVAVVVSWITPNPND